MINTLFFVVSAIVLTQAGANVQRAIAVLQGQGISGNITFTELSPDQVQVSGRIVGLPPGQYGFHVHEKGDLSNGCLSMAGHYNPFKHDHGHPHDENRHVGDLGNVVFDASGTADLDFIDIQLKLNGDYSIVGRGVVLHEKSDDFGRSSHPDSKKTGNAGGRVACGVIGILDFTTVVGRQGSLAAGVYNNYFLTGAIITMIISLM